MLHMFRIALVWFCLLMSQSTIANTFKPVVAFSVKEVAGVGADQVVSAVIPLPYGAYQQLQSFRIVDAQQQLVPAQFEVLNRWWSRDNSIRHLQVHFMAQVSPYHKPGSGMAHYQLVESTQNLPQPIAHPLQLQHNKQQIQIDNGLLQLTIQRQPFAIQTPAGPLQATLFQPDGHAVSSFARSDIQIQIESQGPIRSVIKASAPTRYLGNGEIEHGWALRLYLYANSHTLKLDYQLQNSAINRAVSAPLYFQGMEIRLQTGVASTPQLIKAQELGDDVYQQAAGIVGNSQATLFIRDFWQSWPNGVEVTAEGDLVAQLWPRWSYQFDGIKYADLKLYWLDDMRHTVKELYFDFAQHDAVQRGEMAARWQFPPVAVLPVAWYASTKATLDMGGYLGRESALPDDDRSRVPTYDAASYDIHNKDRYIFGWNNFKLDILRKKAPSKAGDWPYRNVRFLLSENPKDYYDGLSFAMAELNIRPQWLAGYHYQQDYQRIRPTSNPYGGESWRRFKGHNYPYLDQGYREGSYLIAKPRDDQHGWFYQVEDAYYYSGNPWIKDWFEFVGEFRKTRLHQQDPYPDMVSRALGHALNQALAAYRVTGDVTLLHLMQQYLHQHLIGRFYAPYQMNYVLGKTGRLTEASFQAGFLLHALINYYEEIGGDAKILAVIEAYIRWNMQYASFAYYSLINGEELMSSDGTGLTMVDPQIWLALQLDQPVMAAHARQYVEQGIPFKVGAKPYGQFKRWQGQYEGRLYNYYLNHDKGVQLHVMAADVSEGENAIVTVGLNQALSTPVQIQLATQSGSAQAGRDFAALQQTFTLAPGELVARFDIPTYPDTLDEAAESFSVSATLLNNPSLQPQQVSREIHIRQQPYQIVVDNMDEAMVMMEDDWKTSRYDQGFYYTNYHIHDPKLKPSPFSWYFTPQYTGQYQLQGYWTAAKNRTTQALYQIKTAQGLQSFTANQRRQHARWADLGRVTLQAGKQYKVQLQAGSDGYTVADAVRLLPLKVDPDSFNAGLRISGQSRIIVDNADSNTNMHGQWKVSSYTTGYYQQDYRVHAPNAQARFSWSFEIEQAGEYAVYARWTAGSNRSNFAEYELQTSDQPIHVKANQKARNGQWVRLAIVHYNAGQYQVTLKGDSTGYVVADAIMLRPL